MKIGFLQFKPEFGKVKENISKIENMIFEKDFDLLVLPELSNSGYLFVSKEELEEYSERASDGIFCSSLLKICSQKNATLRRASAKGRKKTKRYFTIHPYSPVPKAGIRFTEKSTCFTKRAVFSHRAI